MPTARLTNTLESSAAAPPLHITNRKNRYKKRRVCILSKWRGFHKYEPLSVIDAIAAKRNIATARIKTFS